jgi:protein-S-isoprenylcysteine O-methyltransferase Ste14
MKIMGEYFSRTLEIKENHQVIKEGPYSIIRHPGYSTSIIIWIITIITVTKNIIIILLLSLIILIVFTKRINAEETMMENKLKKDYFDYKKEVKYKLFPFIY